MTNVSYSIGSVWPGISVVWAFWFLLKTAETRHCLLLSTRSTTRGPIWEYRREPEVEKLTDDGEVEADGEMQLDETEGIGEEQM